MRRVHLRIVVCACLIVALAGCGASATPTPPTATPAPTEAAANSDGSNAPAETGLRTFVIVPEESSASYIATEEFFADALRKFGIEAGWADAVGVTQAIEGQLQLDLNNLGDALGENTFKVMMNTFVTNQSMRDNWIRTDGPRFDQYPEAIFKATAIEGAPASYTEGDEVTFQLIGDITIREVTKPVTFDVTASLSGDTITGAATTRMLMSDFGIEPPSFANTLTVSDEFGVEVKFTARETP
jgi:polyisoprenoid-binding protein YceI